MPAPLPPASQNIVSLPESQHISLHNNIAVKSNHTSVLHSSQRLHAFYPQTHVQDEESMTDTPIRPTKQGGETGAAALS